MTDAQAALAQVREALEAGPTPGPWHRSALRLQGYDPKMDGCDIGAEDCSNVALARHERDDRTEAETIANAALIAACNPSNMRALLDRLAERDAEIERLRADAERYRWLRDNCVREVDDYGTLAIKFRCDFENYNDVDTAIDSARKK